MNSHPHSPLQPGGGDSGGPRVTWLGKLFILLFIGGCLYGAYALFRGSLPQPSPSAGAPAPSGLFSKPPEAAIGIAYGTEKKRWLEWAVAEFAKTPAGSRIQITLIPMGSLEGAQAVLAGDTRIHVWSPASALYRDVFIQEWTLKHQRAPFLREEPLAMSPMVFVLWKERHEAFLAKYGTVSFSTLGQALAEPSGWDGIAGKPEWGLFKFGHTHPNESNSGLATLLLMAHGHHRKNQGLTLKDILHPGFQQWMQDFERAVSGLSNSTGNMMRDMVLRGPASYDGLCVYENVAIDYLKSAEGRWGELRIAYPAYNLWNDNPYCILDAEWSSPAQRQAAGVFLDFLLSEPVQKQSVTHGFRPGNPVVPIKFPGSPFEDLAAYGIRIDVGQNCEPPKAEVIQNLLASWQRTQGPR